MEKYLEGKTTQTWEKVPEEYLDFPQMTFCVEYQFKTDALFAMGLPDSFLIAGSPKNKESLGNKSMPNLEEVWEKATYSEKEFFIRFASNANILGYIYICTTLHLSVQ